jgi:arylsulfatase A-like enzyme
MLWSQGHVKKERPWEESILVPFTIRYPGVVPEGKSHDVLLGTVDVMPSLLSLIGVSIPDGVEGMDLSAAMRGEPCDGPESAFLTIPVPVDQAMAANIGEWRGVRTKRHTYARWQDGGGWVLYDNQEDPYQLHC